MKEQHSTFGPSAHPESDENNRDGRRADREREKLTGHGGKNRDQRQNTDQAGT